MLPCLVEAPKRKTEEQQQEKARKAQEKSDGDDDDPTPPASSERTPAQQRQASRDAARTKKHGKSYFGYKNHTSVDKQHKLIRSYEATAANKHDGHQLEALIDGDNSSANVWADSAYRSAENESMLEDRGYRSHIHRKKPRGKDMPERSKQANQKRSQVRARVEHVYADVKRDGKKFMARCIGQARAELRIGLMNMVYNARRWSFLSHGFTPYRYFLNAPLYYEVHWTRKQLKTPKTKQRRHSTLRPSQKMMASKTDDAPLLIYFPTSSWHQANRLKDYYKLHSRKNKNSRLITPT